MTQTQIGEFVTSGIGRRRITLAGTVTAHAFHDSRWPFSRWIDSMVPQSLARVLGLRDNLRWAVQVHIDDEVFAAVRTGLFQTILNHGVSHIANDSFYEVAQGDLAGRYALGARVEVSYELASIIDQFFLGRPSCEWDISPATG